MHRGLRGDHSSRGRAGWRGGHRSCFVVSCSPCARRGKIVSHNTLNRTSPTSTSEIHAQGPRDSSEERPETAATCSTPATCPRPATLRARRRRREGGASRSRRRSRRRCGLTRRACQRRSGGRSESSREGAQREPRGSPKGVAQRQVQKVQPRRSRGAAAGVKKREHSRDGRANAVAVRCPRGSLHLCVRAARRRSPPQSAARGRTAWRGSRR